jgi:hypothetical protein
MNERVMIRWTAFIQKYFGLPRDWTRRQCRKENAQTPMGGKSDMETVDIGGLLSARSFQNLTADQNDSPAVRSMLMSDQDRSIMNETPIQDWDRHGMRSIDHNFGPRASILIPFPKESSCNDISYRAPN